MNIRNGGPKKNNLRVKSVKNITYSKGYVMVTESAHFTFIALTA
jgi:hypothetical protein